MASQLVRTIRWSQPISTSTLSSESLPEAFARFAAADSFQYQSLDVSKVLKCQNPIWLGSWSIEKGCGPIFMRVATSEEENDGESE
jgi:hypothetical protein